MEGLHYGNPIAKIVRQRRDVLDNQLYTMHPPESADDVLSPISAQRKRDIRAEHYVRMTPRDCAEQFNFSSLPLEWATRSSIGFTIVDLAPRGPSYMPCHCD